MLRRILEVALSEGCETITLGVFGCGAFQNNPENEYQRTFGKA
jgi:hypothetical protein